MWLDAVELIDSFKLSIHRCHNVFQKMNLWLEDNGSDLDVTLVVVMMIATVDKLVRSSNIVFCNKNTRCGGHKEQCIRTNNNDVVKNEQSGLTDEKLKKRLNVSEKAPLLHRRIGAFIVGQFRHLAKSIL